MFRDLQVAKLAGVQIRGLLHTELFDWEVVRVGAVIPSPADRILLLNGMKPSDFFLASVLEAEGYYLNGPKLYLRGTRCDPWDPVGFVGVVLGHVHTLKTKELDLQQAFGLMLNAFPEVVDRAPTHR